MYDKFKYLLEDDAIFFGVLIVLISLSSFGLGRWSASSEAEMRTEPQVFMTQQASLPKIKEGTIEPRTGTEEAEADEKQYVASKSGSKFHLLTCPGAKQIKEENKIYFTTKEEALKAGYAPASNCKGI